MNASEQRERSRELALQRLAATRLRLRHDLIAAPDLDPATPGAPFSIPRRLRAVWRSLRRGLRGSPLATVAMSALQEWWQRHPWRATSELVAEELHATLTPVVRRHPVATLVVTGLVSLALVSARPWRWPLVSRHLQPLPGRMGRWLFQQLGQAPGQALLAGLLMMMAGRASAPVPPPPEDKT